MSFAQSLLLNLNPLLLAVVIMFGSALFSVVGLLITHHFVPVHKIKLHNEVAGYIFASLGAIYAVLLAFMVVVSWQQLNASGIGLATNPSTSFFYVLTGAHGLHLLAGIGALITIAFRVPRHLTRGAATQAVSIYWHAMNGLWLLLFVFLILER